MENIEELLEYKKISELYSSSFYSISKVIPSPPLENGWYGSLNGGNHYFIHN